MHIFFWIFLPTQLKTSLIEVFLIGSVLGPYFFFDYPFTYLLMFLIEHNLRNILLISGRGNALQRTDPVWCVDHRRITWFGGQQNRFYLLRMEIFFFPPLWIVIGLQVFRAVFLRQWAGFPLINGFP